MNMYLSTCTYPGPYAIRVLVLRNYVDKTGMRSLHKIRKRAHDALPILLCTCTHYVLSTGNEKYVGAPTVHVRHVQVGSNMYYM